MNDQLTTAQMNALMGKNDLTPDNSKSLLGHANSLISKMVGGSTQGTGLPSPAAIVGDVGNSALQFAQSAVHAPEDIVNASQGKPINTNTLPNFTGEGQKTIQGQAAQTASDVFDQKTSPIAGALKAVGNTIGGALNFVGLGAGGKVAAETASEVAPKVVKTAAEIAKDKAQGLAENRATNQTIRALTPKMTSGEMEAAPNAVRPRFGAPRIDLTKDKGFAQMISDTKGIVKGKSAIDDKNALKAAISQTSENLKTFLDKNKVPTNFSDLIEKLKLVNPHSSLKSDSTAFKTYSRVREEIQTSLYSAMRSSAQKSGDFGSLTNQNDFWDAMKILDQKSEEELGTKVFGSPEYTGVKSAIQDMRQALAEYVRDSLKFPGDMEKVNKMQDFIQAARARGIQINNEGEALKLMEDMGIKNTPSDVSRSAFFEDAMNKMMNYYRAMENVSTKIPDEIRHNSTWVKRHPIMTKAAYGAGALVGDKVLKDTTGIGI